MYVIDKLDMTVPMGLVAAAGKDPSELRAKAASFDDLHRGGWDPVQRLEDQDRDGVAAEIIYPTVGMPLCNHEDADYKKACFRCLQPLAPGFLRACAGPPDRLRPDRDSLGRGGHRGSPPDQGDGLQGRDDARQPGDERL